MVRGPWPAPRGRLLNLEIRLFFGVTKLQVHSNSLLWIAKNRGLMTCPISAQKGGLSAVS